MSGVIRISNIDNYNQEIINGELVLTPKNFKKFSEDDFINEQIARQMFLEYDFHGRRSEKYEFEITQHPENDNLREYLKKQVGMIHQIKITIRKRFVQRFGDNLWNELMLEYGYTGY